MLLFESQAGRQQLKAAVFGLDNCGCIFKFSERWKFVVVRNKPFWKDRLAGASWEVWRCRKEPTTGTVCCLEESLFACELRVHWGLIELHPWPDRRNIALIASIESHRALELPVYVLLELWVLVPYYLNALPRRKRASFLFLYRMSCCPKKFTWTLLDDCVLEYRTFSDLASLDPLFSCQVLNFFIELFHVLGQGLIYFSFHFLFRGCRNHVLLTNFLLQKPLGLLKNIRACQKTWAFYSLRFEHNIFAGCVLNLMIYIFLDLNRFIELCKLSPDRILYDLLVIGHKEEFI